MRIIRNKQSVQIVDSYEATDREQIEEVIKCVRYYDSNNTPFEVLIRCYFEFYSICREWEARNLLYMLGINKLVNGNIEIKEKNVLKDIIFALLSLVYRIVMKFVKKHL